MAAQLPPRSSPPCAQAARLRVVTCVTYAISEFSKARVLDGRQLGDDLIDWGAGLRNHAHELECALLNLEFVFASRERAALQADADSHRGLELACREETSSRISSCRKRRSTRL